jgi:hypothetical protein
MQHVANYNSTLDYYQFATTVYAPVTFNFNQYVGYK